MSIITENCFKKENIDLSLKKKKVNEIGSNWTEHMSTFFSNQNLLKLQQKNKYLNMKRCHPLN